MTLFPKTWLQSGRVSLFPAIRYILIYLSRTRPTLRIQLLSWMHRRLGKGSSAQDGHATSWIRLGKPPRCMTFESCAHIEQTLFSPPGATSLWTSFWSMGVYTVIFDLRVGRRASCTTWSIATAKFHIPGYLWRILVSMWWMIKVSPRLITHRFECFALPRLPTDSCLLVVS